MKYNEIKRLQQLAGILSEIKVNNPSITFKDLNDLYYDLEPEFPNPIYDIISYYGNMDKYREAFTVSELLNSLSDPDKNEMYRKFKKLEYNINEIKINTPPSDSVDIFIRNKFKPIVVKKVGNLYYYIYYKLEDGNIINYYPESKKVITGIGSKDIKIRSSIQNYINSLK